MLISFSRAQETNNVESLGGVFVKQADYFKCYRNYIADLPTRLQVLYKLKHARPAFRQFLEVLNSSRFVLFWLPAFAISFLC